MHQSTPVNISNTPVNCPPLESALVRFILEFNIGRVDPKLRSAVSRIVRDQISSQIGNSRLPWSRQVLKMMQNQHVPGRSRVISTMYQMSASDAAFLNATLAHGFEYDEGHRPSNSHPASCAVATAIAVGEEIDASVDELITAILLGYEVYARLGCLAAPDMMRRGFHPAAMLATFGAAAVCAKLRKFDAETTLNALAIALSHASGAAEYSSTGGSIKRLHPGIGVRGGIFSADLAYAGITGPRAFLSGIKGYYRAFLQRDPAPNAETWFAPEKNYEIFRGGFKRYCCCGANHASIDILSTYSERLDNIDSVLLRIPTLCNTMVGTVNANAYTPNNIEQVQFSLPTQAAFALLGLGNGYQVHLKYLEKQLDMEQVLRISKLICIQEDPKLDQQYPGKFVTEATLRFKDGAVEKTFVENSVGTPDNPMNEAAHDAKFLELTEAVIGKERSRKLLELLHKLPSELKISALTALCAAAD